MKIGDLLGAPAVQRTLAAGEERMGKLVTQLLASERVMRGVQVMVSSALGARAALDRGLRTAIQAVNLPTTHDVEELRRRLTELESILDGLATRAGEASSGGAGSDRADDHSR